MATVLCQNDFTQCKSSKHLANVTLSDLHVKTFINVCQTTDSQERSPEPTTASLEADVYACLLIVCFKTRLLSSLSFMKLYARFTVQITGLN